MSRRNSRRRHFVMNDKNGGVNAKNQMPTSMQKFCIDSNIMLNTARKCSLTGKIAATYSQSQSRSSNTFWLRNCVWSLKRYRKSCVRTCRRPQPRDIVHKIPKSNNERTNERPNKKCVSQFFQFQFAQCVYAYLGWLLSEKGNVRGSETIRILQMIIKWLYRIHT